MNFELDPKSGIPFYRQIIDQIRYGIAAGKLKVGDQLPTVRALAVELKVNLNTISKAYRELEIKNILETQQGSGTFIAPVKVEIPDNEKEKKLTGICNEFQSIASAYGFNLEDLIKELQQRQGADHER